MGGVYWKYFCYLYLHSFILSLLGSFSKSDPRIFPFLLFVIPIQIIGYGIGFSQAFIKRFILNKPEMIGFKRITTNDNNDSRNAPEWYFNNIWVLHMNKIIMGTYQNFWPRL